MKSLWCGHLQSTAKPPSIQYQAGTIAEDIDIKAMEVFVPKKTWIDELAKHFPAMIIVLLALFAFTLTNCSFNEVAPKTQSQKKAAFAGTWARAADYCQYIRHENENCIDVEVPKDHTSGLIYEDSWKVIEINDSGVVSSYINEAPLAVIEITSLDKHILKPSQNYEYKVQINTTDDLPDPTFIYFDSHFLTIYVEESGTQIPYFRVSNSDAYEFSKANRP